MISRVCRVSIAAALMLAVGSACLAVEPGYVPGKGGVGAQFGGSYFSGEGDYSEAAQPRLSFGTHFRYAMSKGLRWQVAPGYTWAAYKTSTAIPFPDPNFPPDSTKDRQLSLLVPVTAQLQMVVRRGMWFYYAGAGPGLYRVWVENRRKILKDPETFRLHRGLYPGASAEIGAERFLKALTTTSVEFTLTGHYAFAKRDDQFKRGFNSNVMAVEGRIGVNYYFDLIKPKKSQEPKLPEQPQQPR
jgi:hypothetical protein